MSATGSTAWTRWGLPAGLIWAALMLSAWVHTEKMPSTSTAPPVEIAIVFLAVPAFQIATLVAIRWAIRRQGGSSRNTDLLVLWLMTFLFGMHGAVLGVAIGMLASVGRAVPVAIGLLLVGLGPVLGLLEPGSPLGIRTQATQSDPRVWRRVHRFSGAVFVVAGALAPLGLFFEGVTALYAAVAPALVAVALAVLRGSLAGPAGDAD